MTVHWLGDAADDQRFNEARSYLPPCYSNAFDECITKKNLSTFPNCVRYRELRTINEQDPVYKKLEAEVQKMPYCAAPASAPVKTSNLTGIAVAGAAGLVVGLLIAGVLK
ncbi:MAG: hypothetical protein EHM13_11565 [Acidobacteria bacterium]|nr:MAG: hypothetical protein EHM13_11565 [Acidobacteriota bacterium]